MTNRLRGCPPPWTIIALLVLAGCSSDSHKKTPLSPVAAATVTTRIVFNSSRDGNDEIYVMNGDGSGITRLTTNTSSDFRPSWSRDGTRVAMQAERDGNLEIYAMNDDGSNQTRLTTSDVYDYAPAWSPDGTRIAFQSQTPAGVSGIYVMD